MLKRMLFSVIILGVIVSLVYQPARATLSDDQSPGEVVATAFAASRADLTEVNVQTWSKINKGFLSVKELTDFGWLVAGTFNNDSLPQFSDWQVTSGEATGQHQVELTANNGSENASILLQSLTISGEVTGPGETYLIVTINGDAAAQVINLEYQATNAFSPFQLVPRLAVLYTGQLDESLDRQGKSSLIDDMLAAVEGKKVEGIEEDFLASYSGYTPLLADSWWTGSNEINLQIGVRDHSDHYRTIIYVGYPMILTGY